ncbi:hypothetical protein P691DRAFT_756986 [Macrolepiota fuliginosa MF-IS2]|uniref:Uncharacterized protein n=1 Tax=Macrolepiota fuliginosa MF-IS2 TaxID=1400762 RepID=A0A9P5XJ17_9AGAR|nr:hypothetical protein P691DRAFT_756986 [Macrolepiota fuliginosa MF-IS2]
MLKRQRASSPLPSSPSVPQGTSADDVIDIRDLKRRRVAPPPLNGQTRGWSNSHPTEGDNEEEYTESDGQDGRNEANFAQPQSPSNVEYSAVNSVLKKFHILYKHRHLFSVNESPLHSPADKNRTIYPPEGQTSEESARVYEHYEDTNRSLASAFLSRRQHSPSQP